MNDHSLMDSEANTRKRGVLSRRLEEAQRKLLTRGGMGKIAVEMDIIDGTIKQIRVREETHHQ